MARAIRLGERLRGKRGSFFNHACLIDRIEGDQIYILQAEPVGVTNDKLIESIGSYVIVEPPDSVDKDRMMEFARKQVGLNYDWFAIMSILVDILTPNWFPAFRHGNTWICSALVAESMRFGGWYHGWPDIYIPTPAQLWVAIV